MLRRVAMGAVSRQLGKMLPGEDREFIEGHICDALDADPKFCKPGCVTHVTVIVREIDIDEEGNELDEPALTTTELLKRLGVKKCDGRDTCAICLRAMKKRAYVLPCEHEFHGKCIRSWFDRDRLTCPTCRADATSE
jgi:hypothetical protein